MEDGLSHGLKEGQADDGENEDVLHSCSLSVLETSTGSLAFYNQKKSRSDAARSNHYSHYALLIYVTFTHYCLLSVVM